MHNAPLLAKIFKQTYVDNRLLDLMLVKCSFSAYVRNRTTAPNLVNQECSSGQDLIFTPLTSVETLLHDVKCLKLNIVRAQVGTVRNN